VSLRLLQLSLLVVAASALALMTGVFPVEAELAFLGAVLAGTWLTAGERKRRGGGWWTLLAAGAALSVAGLVLSWPAETAGGVVTIAGAALVVIAATIGFPLAD
jgi:hypothetical protein